MQTFEGVEVEFLVFTSELDEDTWSDSCLSNVIPENRTTVLLDRRLFAWSLEMYVKHIGCGDVSWSDNRDK
jgi:hypothetical protein